MSTNGLCTDVHPDRFIRAVGEEVTRAAFCRFRPGHAGVVVRHPHVGRRGPHQQHQPQQEQVQQ